MKKHKHIPKRGLSAFPLCLLSLAISSAAIAQDNSTDPKPSSSSTNLNIASPIEDVLVLGRIRSATQDLALERMEAESVVDLIGAEQIARIGDSSAAVALKRVPGVTLVNGKFIYVRGLGERYSSTRLNGATVPSPDLTRSVLPLDIFPASIIESMAVYKGFTSDMPAVFGGGSIDIRTIGIPDEFIFSIEAGLGKNSNSNKQLWYDGGTKDHMGEDDGTRALGAGISSALQTYYGSLEADEYSLNPSAIRSTFARNGEDITIEEAQAINASLATEVYRDLNVSEKSKSIHDGNYGVTLGNSFDIGDDFQAGFLATYNYDRSTRSSNKIERSFRSSNEEFTDEAKTVRNMSITATANLGVRWKDDHEISSKNIFIRNTDDEVSISNIYNSTSPLSSGQGSRNWDYRFEQRELEVYQFTGTHTLGYDTREQFGLGDTIFDEFTIEWYYSDSTATTDIPSETNIKGNITQNNGNVESSRLINSSSLMDIRFTELDDEVESSGIEFTWPINLNNWEIELSAGSEHDRKVRTYKQLDLALGTSTATEAVTQTLTQDIASALSDSNILNPNFDYTLTYRSGLSRSYLAAATTDAAFGEIDVKWNQTWRFVLGARYEDYKQFSAPWRPYSLTANPIRGNFSEVGDNGLPEGLYFEDEIYPSLAVTYSLQDFWAEDFNLRFNFSETVVRPDLREVSDSSYRDPLTDIVVNGNPDAVPTDITNLDIKAEWVFGNGDNFSATLFHKDLDNPIEYFQVEGSEDSIRAVILNSSSGETKGIEFEWMKNLEFLGRTASQFYISGNITLSDSEIDLGDINVSATNRNRPLSGASDEVINIQLGFDSDDGKHTATLAYNVFGERIYTAGTGEEPDSYEQPFDALDFSYAYYPTDSIVLKAKIRNVLDESITIKKGSIDVYEEDVGRSFSISAKYNF